MRVAMKRAPLAMVVVALGAAAGSSSALAATVTSAAPPARATAQDLTRLKGITPETLALMNRQARLERVIDRIKAATTAGLGGVSIDPEHDTLHLAWKGAVPGTVRREVDGARARGMTVDVTAAPYTEKQLDAEVTRLSRLPLAAGRTLQLSAKPDGSGLDVGVSGLPAGTSTAAARQLVPALQDSEVPLSVKTVPAPTFAARGYDTPFFWGGSYIERWLSNSPAGNSCSSSFGVTGNNSSATYLLTAAHCGEGEWRSVTLLNGDGTTTQQTYGSTISTRRSTSLDAEVIFTPNGAGGSVYVGDSINFDTGSLGSNSGIPVDSTADSPSGALVCTSGSFSGTICNIRVTLVNVTITINPATNGVSTIQHLNFGVKENDGTGILAAVGQGDSGGPVFSIINNRAIARGVISAMRTGTGWTAPCAGWAALNRVCANNVYYGDLNTLTSALGMHVNTGG